MYILLAEPFDRKLAKKIVEISQADINHVDQYGESLLIKLVKLKKKKQVEFLLGKQVLMHFLDNEQKDACDYAKSNGMALELPQFLNCSKTRKKADM